MNHDVLQIIGALTVLAGYVATQLRWTTPRSIGYLTANTIGAGVLAWLAWTSRDWGFLLLEGVWSAVSAASLIAVLRTPRTPDPA
ncbi:CBU_0592 family membrane protein [Catellatospora methionotrophica]|uniref:CBU_0592 family membrane protein n=1 Tax=Catellatospora methionotrophica TaxID=121620 RepID=UPI0033F60FEE